MPGILDNDSKSNATRAPDPSLLLGCYLCREYRMQGCAAGMHKNWRRDRGCFCSKYALDKGTAK